MPDPTDSQPIAIDVHPPEDEFRALVQGRMEALSKLGAGAAPGAGSSAGRLDLYARALERGLERLKEARLR